MKNFLRILFATLLLTLGAGLYSNAATTRSDSSATISQAEATYTVTITEVGPNKVNVVKILRSTLSIELKDAYEMTKTIPSVVKKDASESLAQKLKKDLEAAGAKVTVKKN